MQTEVPQEVVPPLVPTAGAPPPPPPPPLSVVPPEAAVVEEYPFAFHGSAREYFRIWIVNVALTVLSVGLFSAWAKVRSERWFYGNTWVAGAPFEYLAQPIPILKGRLVALAFLGAYVLVGQLAPLAQPILIVLVGLATPWLVVSGLRFRARYSAWQSLNFRFTGQVGDAVKYFLLLFLLMLPTLGMILPYIKYRQRRFIVEEHRFGGSRFGFEADGANFYAIYLLGWLVAGGCMFGAGLLGAALIADIGGKGTGRYAGDLAQAAAFTMVGLVYAGMFVGWVFIAARVTNLTFNKATLGAHGFRSSLRARDLFGLYLGNTLAILLSVGLLVPWAQVRMARYRASHMHLLARGELGSLRAEDRAQRSATGAETADVFDVDLSL
jgi:uncharacterized membrane protein YjgN (DUF898 family)